jgi:D-xylose transport system permease protein
MTTNTAGSSEPDAIPAESPPASDAATGSASAGGLISRVRGLIGNDLGQIPVFIGLVFIAIYFQIAGGGFFLTPQNLTNLVQQIITIAIVALAAVMVLLIGEIDLSLAAVSALCGAFMGVLSARHDFPAWAAILVAILAGLVIGAINGFFISVLLMPSFIVTLAALIFYQGLLLAVLFPQTTLPIRDDTINNLAVTYLPEYLGVGIPIVLVALYALNLVISRAARQRAGLPVMTVGQLAFRIGLVAVIAIAIVTFFDSYLGVPLVAIILVGLLIVFWLITTRTRFGRHIYAVGGNTEAARRAGIRVVGLRIMIFSLASMLAAIGGILLASRQVSAASAVDQTLLLSAIAAAVIGGVSLFGGRGSVWAVVLGSLIVGSLENGLDLIGQSTAVKNMVEGVVLLLAVLVDALSRRRNATGLR